MFGGAGLDTFDFNSIAESPPGALRDIIGDFEAGGASSFVDRIDLLNIDASTLQNGNQAFTYIGSAGFTAGVAGEVRAFQTGGKTVIQGNVDGDVVAEFEILIFNAISLTNLDQGDFVV